jgi:hypothetical protein
MMSEFLQRLPQQGQRGRFVIKADMDEPKMPFSLGLGAGRNRWQDCANR